MTIKAQVGEMLRDIFRRAHEERENLKVEDIDRQAIMDQIRKRGRLSFQTASFSENFERFVWRLAPSICLSILLLIVLTSIPFAPIHTFALQLNPVTDFFAYEQIHDWKPDSHHLSGAAFSCLGGTILLALAIGTNEIPHRRGSALMQTARTFFRRASFMEAGMTRAARAA